MLACVHLVFARSMRALARLGMAIEGNAGETESGAGCVVDLKLNTCNDGALTPTSDTKREIAIAAIIGAYYCSIENFTILVVNPHSSRFEVR